MTTRTEQPLAAYADRILNPEDRVLYNEATDAARGGALRGAYILVWLSCAESLKRKFRELSVRDGGARKVVAQIEEKEANHKSVDAFLIERAKEYGLISDSEATRLRLIYDMRCVYGHPYEEQPPIEALVAAAEEVSRTVLGRPTKLRHGYLDEQVRLITTDPTFLDDLEAAVERFATAVHERAAEDLNAWFLRKLWTALEPYGGDPATILYFRRGVWFSRAYLRLAGPEVVASMDVTTELTRYPEVLSEVFSEADLFAEIPEHAQDIMVGRLLQAARAKPKSWEVLDRLDQGGVLTDRQVSRLTSAIQAVPLETIRKSAVRPVHYAGKIIKELKSSNWYRQNPAVDVLRNLGPHGIGALPPTLQHELGNNVLQAAEGDSAEASRLLDELAESDTPWPMHFLEGILAECFVNEQNEIRFKTRVATEALLSLGTVPSDDRRAIIERLLGRLDEGSPLPWRASLRRAKRMQESIESAQEIADEPLASILGPLHAWMMDYVERQENATKGDEEVEALS